VATLRQVNRLPLRMALVWAVVGAVLLAARGVSEFFEVTDSAGTSSWAFTARWTGALAPGVVSLGVFGNLWLVAVASAFSSLPAERPLRLRSFRYLVPAYQLGIVGTLTWPLVGQLVPGWWVLRLAAVGGVAYLLVSMAGALRTRMTDPMAVHWACLIAASQFVVGLSLSGLLASENEVLARIGAFSLMVLVYGWFPQASVCLFSHALDIQPFDDQRPIYVALGAAVGMMVAIFIGGGAGPLLFSLAALVLIFAFLYVLQPRWVGRFLEWQERLFAVGCITVFIGFGGWSQALAGLGILPTIVSFDRAEVASLPLKIALLGSMIAFSAATIAKERSRHLSDKIGRMALAGSLVLAVPQLVMDVLYLIPEWHYESILVRGMFGVAEIAGAVGLAALGTLGRTLGRPRADLRAV
jgi:hypothetical protein